tara:strand:- start:1490 stop:1648 length:159 start_codon:yes stop_codon:yes gene_type:complete
MSLFHRCLAVHITAATLRRPKIKTFGRMFVEAFALTAIFAVFLFFLVGFGDS